MHSACSHLYKGKRPYTTRRPCACRQWVPRPPNFEGPTGLGGGAAGGRWEPREEEASRGEGMLSHRTQSLVCGGVRAHGADCRESVQALLPLGPCRAKCLCPGVRPGPAHHPGWERARGEAELGRGARSLPTWALGSAQRGSRRLPRGCARCRSKRQQGEMMAKRAPHAQAEREARPFPAAPGGQERRPGSPRDFPASLPSVQSLFVKYRKRS